MINNLEILTSHSRINAIEWYTMENNVCTYWHLSTWHSIIECVEYILLK